MKSNSIIDDIIQAISGTNGDLSIKDVLHFCLENGMLDDVDEVMARVRMKKRDEYIKNHPYKPWHGKNGDWYVYLPDEKKGRVLKRRKTKQQILETIGDFWERRESDPTIGEVFRLWLEKKTARQEIELSTSERYARDFDSYFEPIRDMRIRKVTGYDIEEFVLDTIHEHKLTAKRYGNIKTLLYGIFRMAKKMGLVDFSITEVIKDFDLSKKIFAKATTDETKVILNDEELEALRAQLSCEGANIVDLGLYLDTVSGLRVGELAAVKTCDVDFQQGVIHVCRSEVRHCENGKKGKGVYEVRDFPKTEAGIRDVIIPEHDLWILKRIRLENPFGEYLFEIEGERVRTYVFRNRLKFACKKAGIPVKPPHSIRRTYATILIDNGVDKSLIIEQMGHTDILTTLEYYYKKRSTDDQKRNVMNRVVGL